MPIILNDNRYDETHNDDGSITRLDRELSIVTGTISKLKNQNNQKDGLYTWHRGELNNLSNIITDNVHLTSYLRNRDLPFTMTTQMKLEEGNVFTFIGHIEQFTRPNGAYSLTLKTATAINDDFDYETIKNILLNKKVNKKVTTKLLKTYKDNGFSPIDVIIDIKRGTGSYILSDLSEDIVSNIQRAMDTQGDNLSEAIVKAELLPYFSQNNSFAKQMYQLYGFDSMSKLKNDPWELIFDISHFTLTHADKLATILGYDLQSDPRRIHAIIKLAFNRTIEESNYTYVPQDEIKDIYNNFLKQYITFDEFERILKNNLRSTILKTRLGYQPHNLYWGEHYIFTGYKSLNQKSYSKLSDDHFNQILKTRQKNKPGFQFTELQEKAVRESVESGLFILTGGPGTGKTTTLESILQAHQLHFNYPTDKDSNSIMLLAPTGKAATRMMNQTGMYASTIHRQLLLTSNGCRDIRYVLEQFKLNKTRLIVIDEASMLDTVIAGTIFDILEQSDQDLKLIIVGDKDQLPSIGPGQVLTDLLNYHKNVVTLTEVKRQTDDSNIIELASIIRNGNFPKKDWFNGKDDVFLVEPENSAQMLKQIRTMLARRQKFGDISDFQILTPYVNQSRQAKFDKTVDYDTCAMINHYTQQFFNSPYYDESKADETEFKHLMALGVNNATMDKNIKRFVNNGAKINGIRTQGRIFRVGDRVICNLNINQYISNGSVGTLRQIGTRGSDDIKDWTMLVEFDGLKELHEFSYENWHQIDLAYAITIHKSQGSEYKNVFLTLTRTPRYNDRFLNRNIVYTAVTRASNVIVLMGKQQDFAQAVFNQQPERKTGLAEMLKTGKTLRKL